MNLLVTGGCGFIGSNFINYWFENHPDDTIVNVDAMTYAAFRGNVNEKSRRKGYHLCIEDILCTGAMEEVIGEYEIDTVVNFAAESHVDRSIDGADDFIGSNFTGVYSLIKACMNCGDQIKKFVQISTDEVCGDLPLDSDESFAEGSPLAPNNPYSATKASAELLIRSYVKTYGFPAVITRCCNNFGPNQYQEKFMPVMIQRALKNESMPIYGQGYNVREWIYVEDHCSAIAQVVLSGKLGEIYNIGSGYEVSNLEMSKDILKILGKPESLLVFVDDRLGHDLKYSVNSEKIKSELGWSPSSTFEEGLKKTIEYYKRGAQ